MTFRAARASKRMESCPAPGSPAREPGDLRWGARCRTACVSMRAAAIDLHGTAHELAQVARIIEHLGPVPSKVPTNLTIASAPR